MKMHELKSWPDYFAPLKSKVKTFELRKNDRDFKVNDILIIKEFNDRTGQYTGEEIARRVVFILDGIGQGGIAPLVGLHRGYVILGLEPADNPADQYHGA